MIWLAIANLLVGVGILAYSIVELVNGSYGSAALLFVVGLVNLWVFATNPEVRT